MNLRDPFDVVHQKARGGKTFDYVTWSQVADRLDAAAPGWSFEVVQLHDDWCLGRLTIGDRRFENVGYAESADEEWKKEALKDAVSDALKRCAAIAGVGRYLYDKDTPPAQVPAPSPPRPSTPPSAAGRGTHEPPPLDIDELAEQPPLIPPPADGEGECPVHHLAWVLKPGGVSKAGKAYEPFWTCPSDERPWCTQKPSARWKAHHER